MDTRPKIRYFPDGKGIELFALLSLDPRFRVEMAGKADQQLDHLNNVCAWVTKGSSTYAIGGRTEEEFVRDLRQRAGIEFQYAS